MRINPNYLISGLVDLNDDQALAIDCLSIEDKLKLAHHVCEAISVYLTTTYNCEDTSLERSKHPSA